MDSRSGGKIVRNRRKRLAIGPYDGPSEPLPKSPNWFTGHVFPATRTILSGAAKVLTSVFHSDSSSSSSSDSDSIYEDDGGEENDIRLEMDELNKDPHLSGERSRTKHLIEQLLMRETFSRKERDKLVTIINSRVVDSSSLEGEGGFGLRSAIPHHTVPDDALDLSSQPIIEARKWLEEKRGEKEDGLGSDITHGGLSSVVKNVDDTFGSPVDIAKSYMKVRPPWDSPAVVHSGLRTSSRMKAKLFEEGTPYTVSTDSSKKKNLFASGSWNIQDEIRKVRSKATEDLLRGPLSKETDHSIEYKSEGKSAFGNLTGTSATDKINDSSSLRLGKLSDVPVECSGVEKTQDDGENETGPLNPELQDQGVEAMQDGEHAAHRPSGPLFPSEHTDGLHMTGSDAQEAIQPSIAKIPNGYISLEASWSAAGQKNVNIVGGEKQKAAVSSEDKLVQMEGKCELLSESAVDVPDMNETTESPDASMPSEELSQDEPDLIRNMAKNGKAMKQPAKRAGRNAARKTRARGK